MINILIVDDNFLYAKKLINVLAESNSKVRLCHFCTDGNEVINLLDSEEEIIDIILLDLKLPNFNGIDILRHIEEKKLDKYKNSIIVISGEIEMIAKIKNNKYLYTYIDKVSGFDNVLKKVSELINIKENEKNSLEYKIYRELKKLNFNFTYIGTRYIIEAITIIYKDYKNKDVKLERNIYPIIAKKYKKTKNNIKTNIINATDLMYYDCEFKVIKEYFGIIDGEKPTPKVIMTTIIEKIKYYEQALV